jgi:hypothetical protein
MFSGQSFSPASSKSVSDLFGLDSKTPERGMPCLLSAPHTGSSFISHFGNEPKVPNSSLNHGALNNIMKFT